MSIIIDLQRLGKILFKKKSVENMKANLNLMKMILCLSASFISCNYLGDKENKIIARDLNQKYLKVNSDENYISLVYLDDTVQTISKSEYNKLINNELRDICQNSCLRPDSLYNKFAFKTLRFGYEQGKDLFYLIYAKYLSENNNKSIPEVQKTELEEIFYALNVFVNENHNLGSGFYHMYQRIPALVQYELLNYSKEENQLRPNKNDKEHFLYSLKRQVVVANSGASELSLNYFNEIINSKYKLKKPNHFLLSIMAIC